MEQTISVSIVDDDETVRVAMKGLVESFGYDVETFDSAASLLASRRLREVSCLIVDVQMPKMSGLELFDELKDAGIKIPVVFVTAFPNDNLRDRTLKAGAVAYLAKPCSGSILLENIKKAVEYDKLN